MPKVSVVIPNYNGGRFLKKRLESVLAQTYQDFEIIYIDDGSIDNSRNVFAEFSANPKIKKVITNDKNSGTVFKQWNKGVHEAEGEYVWIAEADDYADPAFLKRLVEKLDKYPRVGMVYCQSWGIDEDNNITSSWLPWTDALDPRRWREDFVNKGIEECKNYSIFRNTIPNASAVLFRRALYNKIGGADEDMKLAGDWLVWVKILLISDVAYVADPLNYFRTHKGTNRTKARHAGYEVGEVLKVKIFIAENSTVPKKNLTKASQDSLDSWISQLVVNGVRNIFSKKQYSIYKKLFQLNPDLKVKIYIRMIMLPMAFIKYKIKFGSRMGKVKTLIRQLRQKI